MLGLACRRHRRRHQRHRPHRRAHQRRLREHRWPDPHHHRPDAADLVAYRQHLAELAQRRRHDSVLYARWQQSQTAIAERDRRKRAVRFGLGAAPGLGRSAPGVAGWLFWHALTGLNRAFVLPLALLDMAVLGSVGHR